MSKYTPGPWEADREGQVWRNELRIADTVPRGVAHIAPRSEREANVRLIAAAPDLLAALEALIAGIEDASPVGCGNCVDRVTRYTGRLDCTHANELNARMGRARAAISKARGG